MGFFLAAGIISVLGLIGGFCQWRKSNKDFEIFESFSIEGRTKIRNDGRKFACAIPIFACLFSCFLTYEGTCVLQRNAELNAFISINPDRFHTRYQADQAFYNLQARKNYQIYLRENSL